MAESAAKDIGFEENTESSDLDRDSLFIMPLSIVPIETAALRRARIIKNGRLFGVVELFDDVDTGSGQIEVDNVPQVFYWPEGTIHPDLALLRKLAMLPSYDVYSLRILLRENDIPIADQADLKLSGAMVAELNTYMTGFTRPLIQEIYGGTDVSINSFDDVLMLFRDPDVKKAKEKLQVMADKLGIGLADIPNFLEDYGDIFLSLSYYRRCLDEIEPAITGFLNSVSDIKRNFQLKNDVNLMNTCKMMESTINELMAAITGRFENFDRSTQHMWDEISAERFRKVEQLITSYHSTIGGVLCSLTVKMNAWLKLFPNENAGGPMRRAEFIMSEMRQGIENIQKIEDSAPMLSELT